MKGNVTLNVKSRQHEIPQFYVYLITSIIKVSNHELWLLNQSVYYAHLSHSYYLRENRTRSYFINQFRKRLLCDILNCTYNLSRISSREVYCLKRILSKYGILANSTSKTARAFVGFLAENDAAWLKPERPNCIRRHGRCILKFHIQQSRYSNNALIGIILSVPSVPRFYL